MKYKMGYYVLFDFDGKQRDGSIIKSSDDYAIVLLDGVETSISPENILMFNENPTMSNYSDVDVIQESLSWGSVPDSVIRDTINASAARAGCSCISCRLAREEISQEEFDRLLAERYEENRWTLTPSFADRMRGGFVDDGFRPDTMIIDDLEKGPENA